MLNIKVTIQRIAQIFHQEETSSSSINELIDFIKGEHQKKNTVQLLVDIGIQRYWILLLKTGSGTHNVKDCINTICYCLSLLVQSPSTNSFEILYSKVLVQTIIDSIKPLHIKLDEEEIYNGLQIISTLMQSTLSASRVTEETNFGSFLTSLLANRQTTLKIVDCVVTIICQLSFARNRQGHDLTDMVKNWTIVEWGRVFEVLKTGDQTEQILQFLVFDTRTIAPIVIECMEYFMKLGLMDVVMKTSKERVLGNHIHYMTMIKTPGSVKELIRLSFQVENEDVRNCLLACRTFYKIFEGDFFEAAIMFKQLGGEKMLQSLWKHPHDGVKRVASRLSTNWEILHEPGQLFDVKCAIEGCDNKDKMSKCSKCKNVHYCSLEHQKQDWLTHKLSCKEGAHKASLEKMNMEFIKRVTSKVFEDHSRAIAKEVEDRNLDLTNLVWEYNFELEDDAASTTWKTKQEIIDYNLWGIKLIEQKFLECKTTPNGVLYCTLGVHLCTFQMGILREN